MLKLVAFFSIIMCSPLATAETVFLTVASINMEDTCLSSDPGFISKIKLVDFKDAKLIKFGELECMAKQVGNSMTCKKTFKGDKKNSSATFTIYFKYMPGNLLGMVKIIAKQGDQVCRMIYLLSSIPDKKPEEIEL